MVVQSSFQVSNEALNEREGTEALFSMMSDGTRVVCHPALDEVPENFTLLPLCESIIISLPFLTTTFVTHPFFHWTVTHKTLGKKT